MATNEDSFLPRIRSVFYAGFDVVTGPKIIYQVPEGLIASPHHDSSATPFSNPSSPNLVGGQLPPTSSHGIVSPVEYRSSSRLFYSPSKRNQYTLFNFEEISKFVIPPPALCGRLVICSTRRHRIIGFPVLLEGEKYHQNYRNFFRFNLCFVFERVADLSCYEPIVRKISRVLTSCEEESGFLSSPEASQAMHAVLEQLYEDLNSYSETSIPIDQFNSIELKIFPFYPNPPPVNDWMVPLALINLTKRIEDNWDLTMAKVCRHINGINHVSRIAYLADCDVKLTRDAISHLLYYQVIMTIDIFQYSNMYTLSRNIQWLAHEAHVREECGPYSTKPGYPIPEWPALLHLYSRMKPGKTILEWMQAHAVHELGIDVRRFTSFGVIKGFLRRVHRWPVLLQKNPSFGSPNMVAPIRKRVQSFTGMQTRLGAPDPASPTNSPSHQSIPFRGRSQLLETQPTFSLNPDQGVGPSFTSQDAESALSPKLVQDHSSSTVQNRTRRSSAAERILEVLRSRDQQAVPNSPRSLRVYAPADNSSSSPSAPPSTRYTTPQDRPFMDSMATGTKVPVVSIGTVKESDTHTRSQSLLLHSAPPNQNSSPTTKVSLAPPRPRLSRSPSAPVVRTINGVLTNTTTVPSAPASSLYPPELVEQLDGEHHTDELAVRFQVGWPLLEQWLMAIGGGEGEGDFGRVCIIYR
ncbi:NPR2-domain-containing protein [Marasmius fiardii PR-910]|nr:NPR2-domain-containing protein [Marasmius fiardii PR-910]